MPDGLPIEPVDDPTDPRLDDYRDLRDGRLRREAGLFVAEGRLVVRRLLAARRFRPRSLLLTPAALADLGRDLGALPAVRVYLSPLEVVQTVVGFRYHRGCLAAAERGAEAPAEPLVAAPGRRLVLVLENIADPENVGALFRNAMAFGADAVLLSPGTADPLYRKAIRTSAGASVVVPFARLADWPADLRRLRERGYALLGLTPRPAAADVGILGAPHAVPERVALLVGSEGAGLAPETLERLDLGVRIAMAPGVDSLNVATAAAIALHRLHTARAAEGAR